MNPAPRPPPSRRDRRLLVVDAGRGAIREARYADLADLLAPGDVLVVNDAATLPACLRGTVRATGAFVEARLMGRRDDEAWDAALLGEGDARARTEDRAPPPPIAVGDVVSFRRGEGAALDARVLEAPEPRRVALRFDLAGGPLLEAVHRVGTYVQYAYVKVPLAPWDVQTIYASRPWAVEAPSAGLGVDGELLVALVRRGVRLARVTHAAGLSSTGDAALDARLPLAERWSVPVDTARVIAAARAKGARVVAMGTTVARALESAARATGTLAAGSGITDLRLGPRSERRVVDALVTGFHDAGASHLDLVEAFVPGPLLRAAYRHAESRGYLAHELGDACLAIA